MSPPRARPGRVGERHMTEATRATTNRHRASPAQYEYFQHMSEFFAWLERIGLTIEDAERTMQRACAITGNGAMPYEIVRYFAEVHGVPDADEWRVEELAALLAYRKKLQRIQGGRYSARFPRETVTALVTLPIEELELIRPYIHRGSALFPTDSM